MFVSDEIENYMESVVDETFSQLDLSSKYDDDYIKDLYCLTLNNLPAKYVRYAIDVKINDTPEAQAEMAKKVREAIAKGQSTLALSRRQERDY